MIIFCICGHHLREHREYEYDEFIECKECKCKKFQRDWLRKRRMEELTEEERKWIKSFKRVMKKQPKRLWLFANGSLYIMKTNNLGNQVLTDYGGVDQNYCITIAGKCEGGDF